MSNIAKVNLKFVFNFLSRTEFKCSGSAVHAPRCVRFARSYYILDGAAHMCIVRESQSHAKASKNRTADLSGLFLLYL